MRRKLSKRNPPSRTISPSPYRKPIVHILNSDDESDYSDSDFTSPRTAYLTAWPISPHRKKDSTSSTEEEMEELDQDPFAAPKTNRVSFYRPRSISQSSYTIEPSVAPLRLSPKQPVKREPGVWEHERLEQDWLKVQESLKALSKDRTKASALDTDPFLQNLFLDATEAFLDSGRAIKKTKIAWLRFRLGKAKENEAIDLLSGPELQRLVYLAQTSLTTLERALKRGAAQQWTTSAHIDLLLAELRL